MEENERLKKENYVPSDEEEDCVHRPKYDILYSYPVDL